MDTWYWIMEYGKVLVSYGLLMFVWPSVVFYDYLKDKSRTVRFGFCVTVPIVLVNTVVLLFGLLSILNAWTIRAVFYGIFLWALLKRIRIGREKKKQLARLVAGTQGIKSFLSQNIRAFQRWVKDELTSLNRRLYSHRMEYLMLTVVVIFGMVYFSYGAFCNYSYGFGDMYTHHSWIYGLIEGQSFSAGVYPEAMHCFIYSLHVLFGVRVYSCMLFLAGIHVAVFLVAAYCLLKEIFHWSFSPVFVLTLFLTVDLVCVDEIFSMSRLQWTLPQEFGLYTQFLCALFLIRFLKTDSPVKKLWKNENLLLFLLALAASLAIHFYTTIMAFFLCLAFAVCALHRVFTKGHLLPLMVAVICGVLLAVAPMTLALAEGIPFQGSIGWAINIINGTDTKEGRTQQAETLEETSEESGGEVTTGSEGTGSEDIGSSEAVTGSENTGSSEPGTTEEWGGATGTIPNGQTGQNTISKPQDAAALQQLKTALQKWLTIGKIKLEGIYRYGYLTLYREQRAEVLVAGTVFGAVLWFVYRIVTWLFRKRLDKKYGKQLRRCFDGYPPMILASFLFMVLYAAPFLGMPELIAGSRLCSTEQLLLLAVLVMPVDMLFSFLHRLGGRRILSVLSVVCVGGIYAATIFLGVFHGYLYYELTRYNATVMVTEAITKEFPKNSYTIVSGTDELYQVIEYGRHEEMLTFLQKSKSVNYTLPTEYIFIYVEKKPLQYAQSHFFTGPDWLAEEKYTQYYQSYFSQSPQINAAEISKEKAKEEIMQFEKMSRVYSDLESRTILESKMDAWCQQFSKAYRYEMNTYYEDEDFVCYKITQNPYRLYHLEVQ